MESDKICAFCGQPGPHETLIHCDGEPKCEFKPYGDSVLYGQLGAPGGPNITIHPDLAIEEIVELTTAFMNRIIEFPQVQENPMALITAMQKAMMP